MKDTYITAVLEMIAEGAMPDVVLAGLQQSLKKHGHERLYASVLRGVSRVLSAGSADAVSVTVAQSSDVEKHQTAIKATLTELGVTTEPVVTIDESLIGGYVAEANNQRVDASYKSKLVSVYRNVTK